MALPARDDEHFGLVLEPAGAAQNFRNDIAMEHAKAALRIGNLLAADPTDFSAHVTVYHPSHERHRAGVVHTRTNENFRVRLRHSALYKTRNFFRQMLPVGIEQHDVLAAALEPITQAGFDRFTLTAVLRVNNDIDSGGSRSVRGRVSRSVIDDENVFQLCTSSSRDFADVFLFLIRSNHCRDSRTIAFHHSRTTG